MAKLKKTDVKESLLKQLALMGAMQNHYTDLIDDYMSLWDVKTKLQKDIKTRGVVYEDYSSVGIKMQKNNQSVKDLVMVNRQMLTILEKLGLSTDKAAGGEGDDL